MAYRYAQRNQAMLLPQYVDDYVTQDAAVRAYDAMIDALDFKELGIKLDPARAGCPQYDPRAMLKLLVYGYSYGVRSSRKLEREAHYNLSFIWLLGQLKPDHKTISEFRRNNKEAIKQVLKQVARMCIKLELIDGNTLFVDGSKIRANANIKNTWDKERCVKALEHIDKNIEHILEQCENTDAQEDGQASLVKMDPELADQETLKARVNQIYKELRDTNKKHLNTTDPDCVKVSSQKGVTAGYNAQIAVDQKHGLIVSADVAAENTDSKQFALQVRQANEVLPQPCKTACADSGYSNTEILAEVDKEQIRVVVPSPRQASGKEPEPFHKDRFQFNREQDCYICPEGHTLKFRRSSIRKKYDIYKITEARLCSSCQYFGLCTKDRYGRSIARYHDETLRKKLEAQCRSPEGQAVYKLRQQKAELPFGHLKRNLKFDAFLLRGIEGVKAEFSLAAACFNMARMITIFGVTGLILRLQT